MTTPSDAPPPPRAPAVRGALTLESILETMQDVLYRVDAEGRIEVMSRSGALALGYRRPEDMLGLPAAELWAYPERRAALLAALARDGVARDWEADLRCLDGSIITVATTIRQVEDAEGRPHGYQGFWRDVTERRRAEEALRSSEEKFAQIFRTVPDTIVVSRARDGLLLDVNLGFERATGWTRAEAVGQSTLGLDLWADQEARARMVDDLRATGEVLDREFTFKRRDGTCRAGRFSASTFRIGGELCVVFIMRDVTDRHRLQEERDRLEAQLRQAQKLEAVGQVAGGVAHDFNNLLTVQLGALEVLKELPGLPAEARELADEVEQGARSAAALTRQLLAFSRRQILKTTRVDLAALVTGFLGMLRRVLGEHVQLDVEPAAEPLWVDADVGMTQQVVMNLALNARDAMPGGGRLRLACDAIELAGPTGGGLAEDRPGRYVRLTVTDDGQGMDEATQRRLFEPFFTTKPAGRGTGLGLATVYGIVKQHGGWIQVESRVGHGTTVRVHWPAARAEAPAAGPGGATSAVAAAGRGERVLLVEDDPGVRRTVEGWLARLGFQVLACPDGPSGLARYAAEGGRVDVLLTDMLMPGGLTGRQVVERLRIEAPGLPAVVMSGYSAELVEGGVPVGVGLVEKPCDPQTLARALRRALDGHVA